MKTFTVLITAAGRRVALISAFRKAIKSLGMKSRILTTELSATAPANNFADMVFKSPKYNDPKLKTFLFTLSKNEKIDLIVPTIDPELLVLSEIADDLKDNGTFVLVSSKESNEICCNKFNTNAFFEEKNIPCPEVLNVDEVSDFPVFIKPAFGSSSKGALRIDDKEALRFYYKRIKDPIIQTFIDGDEYTIDCYLDFNGQVKTIVPRHRLETRAGEVSKGVTRRHEQLIEETRKLLEQMPGAIGPITVQAFVKDDDVYFIEINPRFGGGVPLSIQAGADSPKAIIQELSGIEPELDNKNWHTDIMMMRFDSACFLNESELRQLS